MGLSSHQLAYRGKTDEWCTPPELFEMLDLDFDLDPCCPPTGKPEWIPARHWFTIHDNGLLQPWLGRVWLNPPYGPEVGRWLSRLVEHGDGIALVPARTDTRWFHEYATKAGAICFLKGRPHFYTPDGKRAPFNSGAPLMLLGYGELCAYLTRNFAFGASMEFTRLAVVRAVAKGCEE